MKTRERWFSDRLQEEITVVRWGTFGKPVLVLPSAGGDAEEIERFGLVDACGELLAEGRVKLYSVDSVAGQAMIDQGGLAGAPHCGCSTSSMNASGARSCRRSTLISAVRPLT